jgi:hypothetical protein
MSERFQIPSDLVVDQWSSEDESSLILDFLFLHSVWTTFDRLISDKITPAISTPCDFTTKSGGIWKKSRMFMSSGFRDGQPKVSQPFG